MYLCSTAIFLVFISITTYLLVELHLFSIRSSCTHSPKTVNGLVGRGREYQEFVPLMSQEFGQNFLWQLIIEWQTGHPFDEFVNNRVSNFFQFVLQIWRILA